MRKRAWVVVMAKKADPCPGRQASGALVEFVAGWDLGVGAVGGGLGFGMTGGGERRKIKSPRRRTDVWGTRGGSAESQKPKT